VDNADATGKGFVAGLGLMSGGLSGQKVLVLGCGPVGCAAVKALVNLGADAAIYDIDQSRCHDLSVEISRPPVRQIKIENNLLRSLAGHRLLIDATNASGIIDEAWIKPECYIAAPGMPLGLSPAGLKKIGSRILHDPLQTGVATMALEAIKQLSDET
jgi:pyrrolysine biosynthesis protein PylD